MIIIIVKHKYLYLLVCLMNRLRIKKREERNIIWISFRHCIDVTILVCCLIIALNIHPSKMVWVDNISGSNGLKTEESKMLYIFHDYEWNEYIMNDNIHWASSSWDYLFDEEIPSDLRWDDEKITGSVSIWDLIEKQNNSDYYQSWEVKTDNFGDVKENQISMDDIMSDLWIDSQFSGSKDDSSDFTKDEDNLVINVWDMEQNIDKSDSRYSVDNDEKNNVLIIEKIIESESGDNVSLDNDEGNLEDNSSVEDDSSFAKNFTFVDEWWVLPTLVSWNDLRFWNSDKSISYIDGSSGSHIQNQWWEKQSWITIIDDYADCMTPWGYKIHHWDNVLAYKQMEDTPNFCHIERRFCWKWKLSWTYTQQWCSVNKNYTYEQWWDIKVVKEYDDGFNWKNTRQNTDWTVSVKDTEIWWWEWIYDRPNKTSSSFTTSDNIRDPDEWIDQTKRPHPDCTAPRWEKVKYGQFVQAFKHKNWFSDIPCEMQIRICTVWELRWTYTESSCKTWDTSFIDWVYGSPTRKTYAEEKLELIRKQLKSDERKYNRDRKEIWELSNNDNFDELLYILDDNYE